jgi:hypothetical protein
MNRNAPGSEPHLKVVARPSLYTTESVPNASDKPVSILASLEPDSPERKISRVWLLALSSTLLIAAFSYWAYANSVFQQPLSIPTWVETALNISKAPIPVVATNIQPAAAKLEKPVEALVEESRPAIILTESTVPAPAAAPAPAESVAPKPDAFEKLAKLVQEPSKKKSNEQAPVVAAVVEKPINTSKPEVKDSIPHKPAAKVDSKVADTAHQYKEVKTEPAKNAKDGDVDLIAALLSRVSHQDSAAKEVKPKKAGNTATTQPANTANAKRQNKSDPNRDIVTRADGDTTEGLLKRCKALGFFEGELCRIRICSSLWGKDPACSAPEQVALPNPN